MFSATRGAPPVSQVDQLVLEYLLFRGFTQTFQVFNTERQEDRTKGFDVEKLIHLIYTYISNFEIDNLLKLWTFLDARFFSHLDGSYNDTVLQFEVALKKYYLIHAIQAKRSEKVTEFFELHANTLTAEPMDWSGWFKLPFLANPIDDPYFQPFFNPEWSDALFVSLRNFMSLIFRNIPLPKILAFPLARTHEKSLQLQLETKELESQRVRLEIIQLKEEIKKLKASEKRMQTNLQQLVRELYPNDFTNVESDEELIKRIRYEYHEPLSTDRQLFASLEAHSSAVLTSRFSLNGQFLATGSADATVRIWSIKEGKVPPHPQVRYCTSSVLSMAWTKAKNQDQLLLYGCSDTLIQVWNVTEGKQVAEMKTSTSLPRVIDLACSPESSMFICSLASDIMNQPNGALMTWDLATGTFRNNLPIEPQNTRVDAISLNREGTRLLAGASDGMIRLYDLRMLNAVAGWQAHDDPVTEALFCPTENTLLSCSKDSSIIHWDLRMGSSWGTKQKIIEEFKTEEAVDSTRRHIAFNPATGKQFLISSAAGSERNHAVMYEFGQSQAIFELSSHNATVHDICWHPRFPLCATASADCTIRLWNMNNM